MGRKTIKVDIPIDSPDKMDSLVEGILKRYDEDPAASGLDPTKMEELRGLHTLQRARRNEGRDAHAKGEAAIQKANIALGVAVGQSVNTPGTIYHLVARYVRDGLLLCNPGNEEELSTYTFNVVLGVVSGLKKKKKKNDKEEKKK